MGPLPMTVQAMTENQLAPQAALADVVGGLLDYASSRGVGCALYSRMLSGLRFGEWDTTLFAGRRRSGKMHTWISEGDWFKVACHI
jgi:hypothetical protein